MAAEPEAAAEAAAEIHSKKVLVVKGLILLMAGMRDTEDLLNLLGTKELIGLMKMRECIIPEIHVALAEHEVDL